MESPAQMCIRDSLNAISYLSRFKRIIVAELNTGQFADYLQMHMPGREILRINKVEGQPFRCV